MKLAVTTSGGDAPGLNAAVRAVTLAALDRGWEVVGVAHGFRGLLDGGPRGLIPLTRERVRGTGHLGGTILGGASRGDPFRYPVKRADGTFEAVDRVDELIERFAAEKFDAVISMGGDGSLAILNGLVARGLDRIVAIPKTIDADAIGTDATIGFDTAVQAATEAIGKLHTTAEAHDRVFVVEVMGRNAGFLALSAGIAGGADVVLIPEIPYNLGAVCAKLQQRMDRGRTFAVIVIAEGASTPSGALAIKSTQDKFHAPVLGGVGERLAAALALEGFETRAVVLGHLLRGGSPSAQDRLLGLRFGTAAVRAVASGRMPTMVAMRNDAVETVPLSEVLGTRSVPPGSDLIRAAREIGIGFGDEAEHYFDKR